MTSFKFNSLDKSDETISTWTESYEPYEYEPEYDQSSLTTDQITQTTQGTTITNEPTSSIATTRTTIRSETLTIPAETSKSSPTTSPANSPNNSPANSPTKSPTYSPTTPPTVSSTVAGSTSTQSRTGTTKQDIAFETNSKPLNEFELDCDDDFNDVTTTESSPKSEFHSQSNNSVNSLPSVQSQFSHQKSISSSSSGQTHLKYSMTGGSNNARTTRIVIQGQGDSGIQNVINCFGTYRNTSCIRQLCKVPKLYFVSF